MHEALANLTARIENEEQNITGIMILHHGAKLYEQYFHGCHADSRLHVYSVTKSIISLLIGIAIDKGYIKSTQQLVIDFFPGYQIKRKEKTMQHITIEHLLTMKAPYQYKDSMLTYIRYFKSEDHVNFALRLLGGKGPIGDFRYTPLIGPDLLSGILVKATGQSVLAFAQEHVFSPMDISVERSLIFRNAREQQAFNKSDHYNGWAADDKGINTAGWGLTLTPEDMAKIGQLYLQDGWWHDRQIVSKNWISASLRVHSRWEEAQLSYGYLWWVMDEIAGIYAAMGDGGNVIYGNKQKDLVVSITARYQRKVADRIAFINDNIVPIIM